MSEIPNFVLLFQILIPTSSLLFRGRALESLQNEAVHIFGQLW